MKNGFRQSMSWLHTWGGLVVGWILYFVFVTGTLGYLDSEIDQWSRPEIVNQPVSEAQALSAAFSYLQRVAPDAERWFIGAPTTRERPGLYFYWERAHEEGKEHSEEDEGYGYLDPVTAEKIQARDTHGAQTLYRMHWSLHYMPRIIGEYIVGLCSMFMLVAIITGVIVHKKIFKDFFTFRPRKGQRSWLDFHNVLSVTALPFHLMITYSGLAFFVATYMPLIIAGSYGVGPEAGSTFFKEAFPDQLEAAPLNVAAQMTPLEPLLASVHEQWGEQKIRYLGVDYPNDAGARISVGHIIESPAYRTGQLHFDGVSGEFIEQEQANDNAVHTVRNALFGLHEGLFAGPVLRGFYVFSSFTGIAMIATGLILWTVKRREKQLTQEGGADIGYRLVEKLNIGTIVGLPLGVAAFFWANRLLPLGMSERAEWEMHCLFIAWGIMMTHAFLRPYRRAWVESLAVTALAFVLLPFVNAITTDRGFIASLSAGDWLFVGFDLMVLAVGLMFATAAVILQQRFQGGESITPRKTLQQQEVLS